MKRYALVSLRTAGIRRVLAYLPANYTPMGVTDVDEMNDPEGRYGPYLVIEGRDVAGWTLDGYVIPRLASGLNAAREIDLSHPVMKLLHEKPDTVPESAVELKLPFSEVCMHMRVAGKPMFVEPLERNMAQLWTLNGEKFSMAITSGEAGLR